MGRVEIEESLIQLFPVSMKEMKRFNRKSYPAIMDRLEKQFGSDLKEIPEICKSEEDTDAVLVSFTNVILSDAMTNLDSVTNKRKKSMAVLDHNMALAIAIVPLITKVQDPYMDQLADCIVKTWNTHYPANKITKGSQERVEGGFKNGLCYITTAVCRSQNKPDDCYELTLLREYRDEYLLKESTKGQAIVEEYYDIAPTIVKHINKKENANEIYEQVWNEYLVPCISLIEENHKEACKEMYSKMVRSLEEQYFLS